MSLFNTEKKNIEKLGRLWHLEDVITHKVSGNKFRIKEIQEKGFIAFYLGNPNIELKTEKVDQKYYISFGVDLHEYL